MLRRNNSHFGGNLTKGSHLQTLCGRAEESVHRYCLAQIRFVEVPLIAYLNVLIL